MTPVNGIQTQPSTPVQDIQRPLNSPDPILSISSKILKSLQPTITVMVDKQVTIEKPAQNNAPKELVLISQLIIDLLGAIDSQHYPHEFKELQTLLDEAVNLTPQDWIAPKKRLEVIKNKLLICLHNFKFKQLALIIQKIHSPYTERPTFFFVLVAKMELLQKHPNLILFFEDKKSFHFQLINILEESIFGSSLEKCPSIDYETFTSIKLQPQVKFYLSQLSTILSSVKISRGINASDIISDILAKIVAFHIANDHASEMLKTALKIPHFSVKVCALSDIVNYYRALEMDEEAFQIIDSLQDEVLKDELLEYVALSSLKDINIDIADFLKFALKIKDNNKKCNLLKHALNYCLNHSMPLEALQISHNFGDMKVQNECLGMVLKCYLDLHKPEEALKIAHGILDDTSCVDNKLKIMFYYIKEKKVDAAIKIYEECFLDIDEQEILASDLLFQIATLLISDGSHERAFWVAITIGNNDKRELILNSLFSIHLKNNDVKAAVNVVSKMANKNEIARAYYYIFFYLGKIGDANLFADIVS